MIGSLVCDTEISQHHKRGEIILIWLVESLVGKNHRSLIGGDYVTKQKGRWHNIRIDNLSMQTTQPMKRRSQKGGEINLVGSWSHWLLI